jgi:hypothetical protein
LVSQHYSQRKSICDGRIFIERPARTNASLKYFSEDNICSLIINVKPELKLSMALSPIDLPSSPVVAIPLLAAVLLFMPTLTKKFF